MRCPFCNHSETKVIDSRLASEAAQVRRRRECISCKDRFTTYESPELVLPRIAKRDGRREQFDEKKLRRSFVCALEKRPVTTEAMDTSINQIKRKMTSMGDKEVSTKDMGDWVMDELRGLDQVGYIRFASVYLSFDDINAFRETIDRLERDPTPEMQRSQIPLLDTDPD